MYHAVHMFSDKGEAGQRQQVDEASDNSSSNRSRIRRLFSRHIDSTCFYLRRLITCNAIAATPTTVATVTKFFVENTLLLVTLLHKPLRCLLFPNTHSSTKSCTARRSCGSSVRRVGSSFSSASSLGGFGSVSTARPTAAGNLASCAVARHTVASLTKLSWRIAATPTAECGHRHVIVLFAVLLNGAQRLGRVDARRIKVLLRLAQEVALDGEFVRRLEILHPAGQLLGVVAGQVKEVALKVAADANVHARRDGFVDGLAVVRALGEEAVENVVFVGRHHELAHRQSHLLGVVARENVAKVARGDGKVHLFDILVLIGNAQVAPVVVGRLRQDATPIDRIDRPEMDPVAELGRVETGLDQVLAVVERAFDRDAVNIVIRNRRHLAFLNGGNAIVGKENDAVDALFSAETGNRRRTCITAGGTQNSESSVVGTSLEKVLEEVTEHLQSHIFERKGWSVEEFLVVN